MTPPLSPPHRGRLWTLDALRGLAVIGMVETHVYNVGRTGSLAQTGWAGVIEFVNGLVAPAFFVVTGFVLAWRPPQNGREVHRRWRAAAGWWVLATLLHLPRFDGQGALDWTPLRQFDVLHSLALAALALTFLQGHLSPAWRARACVVGAAAVLLATVAVDRASPRGFCPPFLQGWFTHNAFSRFPLLPWSAFLFFGASLPDFLRREGARPARCAALFVTVAALARLAEETPWGRALTHDGRANPLFAVARAAVVGAPVLLSPSLAANAPGLWGLALAWLGRRSLALYAVHLCLFFSTVVPAGPWADRVAGTLTPSGVLAWTVGLLAASAALVWSGERGWRVFWHRRRRPPDGQASRESRQNPLGEPGS